jgi:hypothetical protein
LERSPANHQQQIQYALELIWEEGRVNGGDDYHDGGAWMGSRRCIDFVGRENENLKGMDCIKMVLGIRVS